MQGKDHSGLHIEGHIKIWHPDTGEIVVNKRNAIHYENISIALAESIANEGQHVTGTNYTDVFVTCFLDYGEPAGQEAFDNTSNNNGDFVFDELGLRAYSATGTGRLLTHVIFHPVQKSLNRVIQVDYTVRIQSLTGLSEV